LVSEPTSDHRGRRAQDPEADQAGRGSPGPWAADRRDRAATVRPPEVDRHRAWTCRGGGDDGDSRASAIRRSSRRQRTGSTRWRRRRRRSPPTPRPR